MKTIIAIDPGASGGIAVSGSGPVKAFKMPATQGDIVNHIRDIWSSTDSCVCYLEQVGGFIGKKQPGSAMFKFGEGFGFVKGVLATLGIKTIMVRPQEWQKHFSLGTCKSCPSKTIWKNKLKSEAQRRFPELDVTLATSDALLILEYARHCEK